MTITALGDTVSYSAGLAQNVNETAQGVVILAPGGSAALGTSAAPLYTAEQASSTGTKSNVTSSATSVTLVAANTARKTLIITNESTAVLYIDLTNGTASATSYSVVLGPTASSVSPSFTITNFTVIGVFENAISVIDKLISIWRRVRPCLWKHQSRP